MPIPDNQLRIPARSKVPRPVLLAGLMLLAAACGSRSPMEDGLQRRLPLLPEEVLQSFELADGFRLELAASEPNVADPIAMAFDENGRMFVAEMRGYPLDPPPGGEAAGRIRLLEDRDEDGFFETARVFADRLHWPSGIACFDGGVFVTAAPDILYLKDSTGDGAADVRRTVFTGFGTDKSEDIVNNLKWGLDHWIYGTTSYNGGSVRHVERPGDASVPLASSDFRFHPLTEEFEAVEGTRGDFGNAFDAWGNRFASNSGNPVIHAVFPLRHVVEGLEPARLAVPIFESGRLVFPISKPEPWRVARKTYWNRYVDSTHEMRAPRFPPSELATGGYFTGGAGLGIYKGAAYPPEFRGSAFNPEPAGNLVLHSILERSGITFRARRATEGREFLASTDNWFRPVNLVNGPDGCLYLADMYREVIEDPSAIPGEILEHVDYYTGQDMGRIYRIVPNAFAREEVPRLGEASASELVDTLVHEDGWWRSTAQRLLFERRAVDAAPALRALAGDARSPFGRLHALWLLEGLGLLDDTTLLAALADPHPALRQNAIRLSEARLAQSRSLRASVAAMASDEDVGVRFRVALVIPQMNLAGAPAMLASILRRDPGDEWIRAAVFGGARGDSLALLGVLLRDGEFMADPDSPGAVRQLASGVAATQAPESIRSLLRSSRGLPGPRGNAIRMAAASGVAAGLERTGTSLPDLRDGTADSALRAEITAVLAEAPAVALESDASNVGKRVEAIRLLAWALPDAALDALGTILVPDEPAEIQLAAVRSLAARDEHEVGPNSLAQLASLQSRRASGGAGSPVQPPRAPGAVPGCSAGRGSGGGPPGLSSASGAAGSPEGSHPQARPAGPGRVRACRSRGSASKVPVGDWVRRECGPGRGDLRTGMRHLPSTRGHRARRGAGPDRAGSLLTGGPSCGHSRSEQVGAVELCQLQAGHRGRQSPYGHSGARVGSQCGPASRGGHRGPGSSRRDRLARLDGALAHAGRSAGRDRTGRNGRPAEFREGARTGMTKGILRRVIRLSCAY